MSLRNLIKRLVEEEIENLEEDMSTGEGEVYLTPKAFSKNGKVKPINDPVYSDKSNINRKNRNVGPVTEISYSAFKNDTEQTPKQKINGNIREIAKRLAEVEQLMVHAKKLRSETEDNNVYWKGTVGAFGKISERMNRISNRIKEMWS